MHCWQATPHCRWVGCCWWQFHRPPEKVTFSDHQLMHSWQIGLNLELPRNALFAGNSPLQVGHCWWQLCILVNLTRNMTFLQNGYKWYLSGFNVLAQLLLNLELPRNALLATNSPLHCRLDTARGSCVLSSSVPIIFPQFASTLLISASIQRIKVFIFTRKLNCWCIYGDSGHGFISE